MDTDTEVNSTPAPTSSPKAHDAGLAPPRSIRPGGPPWLAGRGSLRAVDHAWCVVVLAMAAVCAVFFGWRGVLGVAITATAANATHLMIALAIHLVRPRRQFDSIAHVCSQGVLMGLLAPTVVGPQAAVSTGVMLAVAMHCVGRIHHLRIPPVALVLVLLWVLPAATMDRQLLFMPAHPGSVRPAVLRPDRVIVGDVHDVAERPVTDLSWWHATTPEPGGSDAIPRLDPASHWTAYQKTILHEPTFLFDMISSRELPQLDELLVGAAPGMIGATSRATLILLGLFLIYRRMATWTVPVVALIAALATLMAMPINVDGQGSVVFWRLWDMNFATPDAAKLAGFVPVYLMYTFLASPFILIVMILAPQASPMSALGRLLFAIMLGMVFIASQWFLNIPVAAMLSLVVAGAISRPLDVLHAGGIR